MREGHLTRKVTIIGFVSIVVAILWCSVAFCTDSPLPSIVVDGLTAYQMGGSDAAVKAWIKGSAVEKSPEAQSQGNIFRQIESLYGKYVGYDAVQVKEITKSCSIAYVVLNYEKGPLFAMFVCYRAQDKWIISTFNFHTKSEQVFPMNLLSE